MSRLTDFRRRAWRAVGAAALIATQVLPAHGMRAPRLADGLVTEVVATGVGRPIQLAFERDGQLVVLSHGLRGDAAAELLWIDARAGIPVDAGARPRVVIPFADEPRKLAFGSLAVDARTGQVYLGEENGNRVYRLDGGKRLVPVAVGIQHLVGGSSIALDDRQHLLVVDFTSPETSLRSESPPPPGLSSLEPGDYQGPLVFRVSLEPGVSLPRRLDLVPPLFPRTWARPAGEPLTRYISVAVRADGALVLLDSLGQVFLLAANGRPERLARLPSGQYQRTSMALAPDGTIFVSSGFHIRALFRVSPTGAVDRVASDLGDPGGVAIDEQGRLYIAETAFHRIIRVVMKVGA